MTQDNSTFKAKYIVTYKDNPIARFNNRGDAIIAIDLYEGIDKDAGIYEPGCYEIVRGDRP